MAIYQKTQKANFSPRHERRLSKGTWQTLAWQLSDIPRSKPGPCSPLGRIPLFQSANSLSYTFLKEDIALFCITP